MASRLFAQIDCSLLGSKRFRGLSNTTARFVYVSLHLCSRCTYTGIFKLPMAILAHEAMLAEDELSDAITELTRAGLIQYDPEEDYVRITRFFQKQSGPDNPNRIESIIRDLLAMNDVPDAMFLGAVAELAVASVQRSVNWKPDGPGREQLSSSLKTLLFSTLQDHEQGLFESLAKELKRSRSNVRAELAAIFPPLACHSAQPLGKASGTLPEHDTKRDENKTKTNTKTKKNEHGVVVAVGAETVEHDDFPKNAPFTFKGPLNATLVSPMARAARGEKD